MLFSLSSLTLILTFFLPTTLALAPKLLPRSTPAYNVSPSTSTSTVISQDAIPDFIPSRTSLNKTSTDVPECLTDHTAWVPPLRSDCDVIIEAVLLTPTAMIERTWVGTGTLPVWQQRYNTCRLFLFVKDPTPGVWVEDKFSLVNFAVFGAKILRACVGEKTPNLGGEIVVGPNKKFVVVALGLAVKKQTETS